MTQTHYERMRFAAHAKMRDRGNVDGRIGELEKYLARGGRLEDFPFWLLSMKPPIDFGPEFEAMVFTQAVRTVVDRIRRELPDPYSYSLLCRDSRYVRLYHAMVQMGGVAVVQPSMMCEYHGLTFEHAGCRTYDVHPDLGERLAHTELRGINADDLRLPYEAVYLMVPPAAALKVWNVESGWHRVEGIYVVEDRQMRLRDAFGDIEGPVMRGWRIMAVGAPKGNIEYGGITLPDDALSYFRVLLPEGKSLDECVRSTVQEIKEAERARETLWDAKMSEDWSLQFRWAMNVVLYCTWEEPGEHWEANREARQLWDRIQKLPKGSAKRAGLLEKAKTTPRQPRLRLGYKIMVNRHVPKPEPVEGEKSGAFREGPGVRTRVAGHWRRQAYGPGRQDRKIIWIEPHWRNLDGEVRVEGPVHAVR